MILKLFPEAGIPRKGPEGVPDPSPRMIIRSPATRTSLIYHFRSGNVAPPLLNPPITRSRGTQAALPPHDLQSAEVACSHMLAPPVSTARLNASSNRAPT